MQRISRLGLRAWSRRGSRAVCRQASSDRSGVRTRLALGSALLVTACIVGALGFGSVGAAAAQTMRGQSAARSGATLCAATLTHLPPPVTSRTGRPPIAVTGAAADVIPPSSIMNEIVSQAAKGAGGKALQIGFTLASQAILGDPSAETLAKLKEINSKLDDISRGIDKLTEAANRILAEGRMAFFKEELRELCNYSIDQQTLYSLYYVPMVRAATELVNSKTPDTPTDCVFKDPALGRCLKPTEIAARARAAFVDAYDKNALSLEAQIAKIHAALMPGLNSVLGAKGLTIMASSRFLTTADQQALLQLYSDFHEVESLASWMATEYWVSQASKQTRPYTFETIIKDYTDNTADEQVGLPLGIPANAVVDLVDVNATTTDGKPMWAPATTGDESWLPAVPNNDLWSSDNVAHAIAGVNASPDIRGNNWTVPTRMQLTALLSTGCAADPSNPLRYVTTCKNPIPANSSIRNYLVALNGHARDWQSLFCVAKLNTVNCPYSAGGAGSGEPPHGFIWTADKVTKNMQCGRYYTFLVDRYYSVDYTTYSGIDAEANNATKAWHEVPTIPRQIPGLKDESNATTAHNLCNAYFVKIAQARESIGAVLATRYTGAADLSKGSTDYMGQAIRRQATRGKTRDPRTPRCTAAQKRRRAHRSAVYRRAMAAQRRAYFRHHRSPKARAVFVHRQTKHLRALVRSARCIVPFSS
jgi:hypothetical protein